MCVGQAMYHEEPPELGPSSPPLPEPYSPPPSLRRPRAQVLPARRQGRGRQNQLLCVARRQVCCTGPAHPGGLDRPRTLPQRLGRSGVDICVGVRV